MNSLYVKYLRLAMALAIAVLAVVFFMRTGPGGSSPLPSAPGDVPPGPRVRGVVVGGVQGGLGRWSSRAHCWRELVAGEPIVTAEPIRVSTGGSTELLVGGGRVVLGSGTRLTPSFRKGEALKLRMERGSLRARLAEEDPGVSVETDFGEIEIGGGGESLLSLDAGGLLLRVLSGGAAVTAGTGRISASRGETWKITAEGASRAAAEAVPASLVPSQVAPRREGRGLGRLVLRDTNGRETVPLEVRSLRIRTRVIGAVALTEIEQTFYNPTDRRAEGTFYFPVPAGASLSRFAMYVEEELVEGELVDREKARRVYEAIVRKMQDPALMEWQEGNIFKTRIFPIPARGPKRILISYTQVLRAVDGVRRYVYPLVSKITQTTPIGRFELNAELSGLDPDKRVGVPSCDDADVRREGNDASVKLVRENFRPTRDFVLRFGPARRSALEFMTDRRRGEDGFFMLSYLPEPDGAAPEKRPGRDVVLMVDTSLSRRADDYRAQMDVLRTMLGELGPDDRFAVISFDVEARTLNNGFVSGPSAVTAVVGGLEKFLPLGATDLVRAFARLDSFLDDFKPRGRPEVVLVSDGIATIGETAPEKVVAQVLPMLERHRARFHAAAMGSRYEQLVLRELARRTGGLFRAISPGDDVRGEAFRMSMAMDSELVDAPRMEFSGAEVHSVLPAAGDTLVAGEETVVLGRYKQVGALTVTVKRPGADDVAAEFNLPETDSRNVFIPRLWAREKLDFLLLEHQTPQVVKQVVDLSQEFTLITPYTSFLVLESEEAYAEYGIKRQKRRRYWEEMGKLRTAPPPEETAAPAGREATTGSTGEASGEVAPTPAGAARPAPEPRPEKDPQPDPKNFRMADFSLRLLAERFSDGREISTALAALSLEVYYRYLPIYSTSGGGRDRAEQQRAEAQHRDVFRNTTEAALERTVERPVIVHEPAPVQVEDLAARVAEIPAPAATREDAVALDRFETANELDDLSARGGEDMISDIPLGGSGVTGSMGVGGGGMAGAFGYRDGGGRRRAVARFGGCAVTESSAGSSLGWLARHQRSDGRWGAAGYEETSLVLLSFLGAGYTEKEGRHGAAVRKGIAWLIARQKEDGRIGENAYQHALATLALSEAFGMAKQTRTGAAAQKALDYLRSVQKPGSGWGVSGRKVDPLTTVWAVMAMRSARIAGLRVVGRSLVSAMHYIDEVTAANGAVGEKGKPQGGKVHLLNTAACMTTRLMLGVQRSDPRVTGAADILLRNVLSAEVPAADSMYVRYFGTLGIFQIGGDRWRKWNAWNRKIVEAQCKGGPTDGTAADVDGSWEPKGIWVMGRRPRRDAEGAAEGIDAALRAVADSPADAKACAKLAQALAETADPAVLDARLAAAARAGRNAENLVRLRLGLVRVELGEHGRGAEEFRRVYEASGHPENVLGLMVGALGRGGKQRQALDYLIAEQNAGRRGEWILSAAATLLFDPAAKVADPVGFLAEKLRGEPADQVPMRVAAAQLAGEKGRKAVRADLFARVYADSGRAERYLAPYVAALRAAGRQKPALELLMGRVAEDGKATVWRLGQIAGLLFEEKCGVKDVCARLDADLAARPKIRLALFVRCGERAVAAGRKKQAAELYGRAYRDSGRLERYAQKYVALMLELGRKKEVREMLISEAREDNRLSVWRMKHLARMVLADGKYKSAPDRFADETFGDRPRARAALKLELAAVAASAGNNALAAKLYEDIWVVCRRPVKLVEPYISALMGANLHSKARHELEGVIQGGYHTTWAFQSLASSYRALEMSQVDVLRAVSSETEVFPRDVQPRINLAQFYESVDNREEALRQYLEAVKIRPEDAYFYRTAVERAVALDRFDVAAEVLAEMQKRWKDNARVWGTADKELVALLGKLPRKTGGGGRELRRQIKRYLVKDLVVIMSWDTQGTDIDLHVKEPGGAECSYQKMRTDNGGRLDHDDTDGLGPETYTMRRATGGSYKVDAVFFNGAAKTTVTFKVYRNYGAENESVQTFTKVLTKQKERITVTTLDLPPLKKAGEKEAAGKKAE